MDTMEQLLAVFKDFNSKDVAKSPNIVTMRALEDAIREELYKYGANESYNALARKIVSKIKINVNDDFIKHKLFQDLINEFAKTTVLICNCVGEELFLEILNHGEFALQYSY